MPNSPRPTRLLESLNLFGLTHLDPVILAALADERPLLLIAPHGTAKSELLNRLAKLSQWKPRTGPRDTGDIVKGRGITYTKYELVRTYVGMVADPGTVLGELGID